MRRRATPLGSQVSVYRATMEQGTRRLKTVGVPDMTDDYGHAYRVYGLPPGDSRYVAGESPRRAG